MSSIDELKKMLKDVDGLITAKQVTDQGFYRGLLTKLVDEGDLVKVLHGVYMHSSQWEDDMYILQHRYAKGIFSHETALYLHGYIEHLPEKHTMTFPQGYHSPSLVDEDVIIKRAIDKIYTLGIISVSSPVGSTLKIYDLERTLCDMLRGNKSNSSRIINQAMKKYLLSDNANIELLIDYADQLRVKKKVQMYIDILV